jgi:hypothetical protein
MRIASISRFAAAILVHGAASASFDIPPPSVTASLPAAGGEAVTASNNTAYVANASLDRVAVLEQSFPVTYVPVGRTPRFIALGGRGFITSNAGDNTVSVQTTSSAAISVPVGGSGPIVTRRSDGIAFLLRPDGFIVRIDSTTVTISSFDSGLRAPVGHAINGAGNRLYVADATGEVRVFDITAASPAQAMESFRVAGRPAAVAAGSDPKLYVLTDAAGGSLVEIDLASNAMRTFALPGGPQGPRTLVASEAMVIAGFSNELAFFDIATHVATFQRTGEIRALDYNGESGLAFAVGEATLYTIDPRTLEVIPVPVATGSTAVKFLFKLCNAYVAGPSTTIVNMPCNDFGARGIRAHALWWVAEGAESGWGLNIAHHGFIGTLFATWFTYDANGQPTWLVMSEGRDISRNGYGGTLYRTSGPAFNAATFDASKVTRTAVGSMSIGVSNANGLTMDATVDGVAIRKKLARQIFSSPVPFCDAGLSTGALPVYQDLWWNPAESGWGVNIAHQGNILFVTWFTYDTDGRPTWFVGSDIAKTGNATYAGTLYKTFGPPMTASPWDPTKVTRMPVGSVTLTFRDEDNGTFAYTANGASGSKAITRQLFASPVTRCR